MVIEKPHPRPLRMSTRAGGNNLKSKDDPPGGSPNYQAVPPANLKARTTNLAGPSGSFEIHRVGFRKLYKRLSGLHSIPSTNRTRPPREVGNGF